MFIFLSVFQILLCKLNGNFFTIRIIYYVVFLNSYFDHFQQKEVKNSHDCVSNNFDWLVSKNCLAIEWTIDLTFPSIMWNIVAIDIKIELNHDFGNALFPMRNVWQTDIFCKLKINTKKSARHHSQLNFQFILVIKWNWHISHINKLMDSMIACSSTLEILIHYCLLLSIPSICDCEWHIKWKTKYWNKWKIIEQMIKLIKKKKSWSINKLSF